ncbi:leucine efflux protein LeuE [Chromobacterium sp. IIBBL 290-4]|uniref:leucine efflux protein LeuE n=1 Tax=Chromobacterium sp. IIBBL 290-4 TaxID=2953890 RepID=UPI0020B81ED5|nr:leucine efflux protein LeuE [Chromobacterium sp. IIBBL 290-4]UTH72288.1 leucine efflux protein LeuE [Chromobacterium sp. IIBBL 290-4]
MFGITDLTTYLIGTLIVILLPGPNMMFVLSVAAQRGPRAGFAAAAGVLSGDFTLMTLAALGAAGLLQANPALFSVIKYIGGAYLGWLGFNMVKGALMAWARARRGEEGKAAPSALSSGHPYGKALFISLMNPKAILFFVSFFVQFVDPAYPHPGLTFAALGAIVQCCSLSYMTLLILAGNRMADAFRRRRKLSAALGGSVGAVFVGFGAKLAAAGLG